MRRALEVAAPRSTRSPARPRSRRARRSPRPAGRRSCAAAAAPGTARAGRRRARAARAARPRRVDLRCSAPGPDGTTWMRSGRHAEVAARRRRRWRATASRSRRRARAARGTSNDRPFASRPACVSGCARQIRSWTVSTSGGPPGASAAVLPSACTRSTPARRCARASSVCSTADAPHAGVGGDRQLDDLQPLDTTAPRAARPPARGRRTRPSARRAAPRELRHERTGVGLHPSRRPRREEDEVEADRGHPRARSQQASVSAAARSHVNAAGRSRPAAVRRSRVGRVGDRADRRVGDRLDRLRVDQQRRVAGHLGQRRAVGGHDRQPARPSPPAPAARSPR